jgi:hypothetical protein
MDRRAERIGLNEALFREVNERIEDVAETLQSDPETLDILCECGSAQCMERITLRRSDYETLRGDPHLFAVHPGHDEPTVEEVVSHHEGYDVVRKHVGAAEKIAEETDPRS